MVMITGITHTRTIWISASTRLILTIITLTTRMKKLVSFQRPGPCDPLAGTRPLFWST